MEYLPKVWNHEHGLPIGEGHGKNHTSEGDHTNRIKEIPSYTCGSVKVLHCHRMRTKEKLALKDFQEIVNNAFSSLRKDRDFTVVTLACEDGLQIEAHKVILSAACPFFNNLLRKNTHTHPLIYMRGMQSVDLLTLVDFLYYGEVYIYQENLDTFLNMAEELKLKGLYGEDDFLLEEEKDAESPPMKSENPTIPVIANTQRNNVLFKTELPSTNTPFHSEYHHETVAFTKKELSEDIKELDKKIKTMMSRGDNMIRVGLKTMHSSSVCNICGKEGRKHHIKDHIETKHLKGLSFPCNICGKTCRTRNSLRIHRLIKHKKNNNDSKREWQNYFEQTDAREIHS